MAELISKATRNEFREHLVGATLHEIDMVFEGANLTCDTEYQPQVSGQRRTLVERYYHRVNWTDTRDVQKVLRLFEDLLSELSSGVDAHPEWAQGRERLAKLHRLLRRDGYELRDGRLVRGGALPQLGQVIEVAAHLDAPELVRLTARLHSAVDSDPELAIGTAKELVESACKTILEDQGIAPDPNWDLTRLGKEARDCLALLPSDVPDGAKGAEAIKKLLANLGVVVQALGEVRNLYGTGHGKGLKRQAIRPRHARLAVGAATSLVTFLLETHWERRQ